VVESWIIAALRQLL